MKKPVLDNRHLGFFNSKEYLFLCKEYPEEHPACKELNETLVWLTVWFS